MLDQALNAYDDTWQGSGATLTDLTFLRSMEKTGLLQTLMEVTYAYHSCQILLHMLLPTAHPLL